MRSTSGSSSKRSTSTAGRCSTAAPPQTAGRGPVDPGAHFYRSLLLDDHGNPINKRNAWSARSVAYVRLIPPGAADTIHYRLQIPEDAGDKIYLKAKVNYRKFAWWNTQWAYAGVRDPARAESVGDTRRTTTASGCSRADTVARVGRDQGDPRHPDDGDGAQRSRRCACCRASAALPAPAPLMDPSVRERWNDYGIGLLLQGDIKNAEATFLKVTAMEPGYADGWVNVGRARVQEGNMAGAEEVLRKALTRRSASWPRRTSSSRTALKSLGRYDEARRRTCGSPRPSTRATASCSISSAACCS